MKILIITAATLAAIMVGIGGMIHFREHERRETVAVSQQDRKTEDKRRRDFAEALSHDRKLKHTRMSLEDERKDLPRLENRLRQSITPGEAALATEKLRDAKERIKELESEIEGLSK